MSVHFVVKIQYLKRHASLCYRAQDIKSAGKTLICGLVG